MRENLSALLAQPADPIEGHPFLIITAMGTDMFVQFAGGQGEGLLFDLPVIALSPTELDRAKRVLPELGVRPPVAGTDDTTGFFSADLGQDVDAAARLVEAVFINVYRMADSTELRFVGP